MSYSDADRCLAMAQELATANNDMVTYNLAAALSNLRVAIDGDFRQIEATLHKLQSEIASLKLQLRR